LSDQSVDEPSESGAGEGGEPAVERLEVIDPDDGDNGVEEAVDHPAKVMRIGSMLKQLLEEVRATTLDEPSRDRLREIYETSLTELGSALSPDLRSELSRLALPFSSSETPSASELQVAKAQLVGWLEGLVQGMQAMLFAQQMAAQQQLQSMRGQLAPGSAGPDGEGETPAMGPMEDRPGTYL